MIIRQQTNAHSPQKFPPLSLNKGGKKGGWSVYLVLRSTLGLCSKAVNRISTASCSWQQPHQGGLSLPADSLTIPGHFAVDDALQRAKLHFPLRQ